MNQYKTKIDNKGEVKIMKEEKEMTASISSYNPTQEEKDVLMMIRDDFSDAYVSMYKPRREFNDISLIERISRDQLAWNTYQVNDGDGYEEDISESWRSRAMRPVIRNKCISIAAHSTARLIFPKIFAYNQQSEEQKDASQVMRDLIEWSADQSNYKQTSLFSVISALVNPVSIVYTEYCEVYKSYKKEKVNGKWIWETKLDEEKSGFKDIVVPPDQLYIENFYEYNIQNQGFLIWRRVQSYDLIKQKYGDLENFKYVQKGVRVFYNDANQSFYDVYDSEIENRLCEEILYWNKSKDLFLKVVNGVLMCEADNPNPRIDKQYPFAKNIYEPIDERKFFYGKSLSFKLKQDADIVNTLYPMIIDGSYLSIMPPAVNYGDANIDNSVYVPASITSLGEGNRMEQLKPSPDLNAGLGVLNEVMESIGESSQSALKRPQETGVPTAYEMALREKERQTLLGLFIDMIGNFVNDYNKLRISDILQYLTIAEVSKITDNAPLVYKTFLMPERQTEKGSKTRRIDFDAEMKEMMTDKEYLKQSYDLLDEGGEETELVKANPILFRNLKYIVKVSPDVMNPISEELERAYGLELYDRAIRNPIVDQEKATRDFLLGVYPQSKENPEEYIREEKPFDEGNILDIIGMKGKGKVAPSERAMKAQAPETVGV